MSELDPRLTKLSDRELRAIINDPTRSRREARAAIAVLDARTAALDAARHYNPELPPRQLEVVSPRPGMHVAGPVVDQVQRCARCGDALFNLSPLDSNRIPSRFLPLPEGALVERGASGWQGEYLGARQPTCPVEIK